MKHELNGISLPFGGISWDNNTTAKDRFRYLLLFLESKRILTNPFYMELKDECIESVLEIKHALVDITKDAEFTEMDIESAKNLDIGIVLVKTYCYDIQSDNRIGMMDTLSPSFGVRYLANIDYLFNVNEDDMINRRK